MIKYADLGLDKKLNEIVMAGSHDAGITGGGSNIQTQNLDIGGQAAVGVRIFDLRVAAAKVPGTHGPGKQAELRAFHADKKLMKDETKTRYMPDVGRTETITRTKLRGGSFGLGLTGMLQQAKSFVEVNPSEFLILKFDKCSNWELIAEVCEDTLEGRLYRGRGNLNTTSLRALAGYVVCLFTSSGLAAIPPRYKQPGGGILGIKNLYGGGGSYNANYLGMQYFGKGGTSVAKPFGKIGQNEKKQGKLMSLGAASDPNVMGMMYWTTTGLSESIRKRNDGMWSSKNVGRLKSLWKGGLSEAINSRIANSVDPTSHSSGSILKTFMPNFVMIDFADDHKCRQIFGLNQVASTELTWAAQALEIDVQETRAHYARLTRK